jgi:DivIVA domain-containing protein
LLGPGSAGGLPDDRAVTAEDVRALRISVAARGYRMTEVDWLLDQFALTLEQRDAEIARLRAAAHPPEPEPPKDETTDEPVQEEQPHA